MNKSLYLFYGLQPPKVRAHVAISDRLDEALAEANKAMAPSPVVYIGSFDVATLLKEYIPSPTPPPPTLAQVEPPPPDSRLKTRLKTENLENMAAFLRDSGYVVYRRTKKLLENTI